MILVIEQEGKCFVSLLFKPPAFLLKFWAKRIVEIIISKNQESRGSDFTQACLRRGGSCPPPPPRFLDFATCLLHTTYLMKIGNFGNSNWTRSIGAIRIRIRNHIEYGVREIIWCSQKAEFLLSCKLNDDDGKI